MNVLGNIVLDMQRPGYAVIYAVQFDKLSRQITAQLTDKGLPWTVPTGALMTIRYSKPDGTQGFYDTLEDGTKAYIVSGSTVTITLAQQALAAAGNVLMQLNFYTSAGAALSTFSFIVTVQPSVLNDAEIVSSDYYNVLTGLLTEMAEQYADFEQLLKAGYGAPLKAATAAAMTDKNKIYVYTGSESGYTSGHWYYWNGTAWTDGGVYNAVAFTTDTTLTIAGAAADAKATGDQLGNLKSDLDGVAEFKANVIDGKVLNLIDYDGLNRSGYINGNNGEFVKGKSSTGLNCCTGFVKVDPTKKYFYSKTEGTAPVNITQYDSAKNFIKSNFFDTNVYNLVLDASAQYVRVSLASNVANYDTAVLYNQSASGNVLFQRSVWRNGSLGNTANANGISTAQIIPTLNASAFSVLINKKLEDGHSYRYQYSTYSVDNGLPSQNIANRIAVDKTVISRDQFQTFDLDDGSIGFGFTLYEVDETGTAIPLRIESFDTTLIGFIRHFDKKETDDYVLGTDLQKTYVKVKSLGGKIANLQAFVIYNGNYISVKQGTITRQDGAFTVLETKSIEIGHANTLQRGSGNLAYASGWNDQNIYVINLDTLEVTGTIALPTTGHTSAVVDDVRKFCYVFQSDTVSTFAPWNFIVYDYDTEQIISTVKTIAFANIQGMDLFNDRILLMHGMGTSASPSGMHVFNTSGDVLADYFLTTMPSTTEYEGVYIDRESHEIYISDVSANIYRISPI